MKPWLWGSVPLEGAMKRKGEIMGNAVALSVSVSALGWALLLIAAGALILIRRRSPPTAR
jgi:MYXO-CTERM domain-containing protein